MRRKYLYGRRGIEESGIESEAISNCIIRKRGKQYPVINGEAYEENTCMDKYRQEKVSDASANTKMEQNTPRKKQTEDRTAACLKPMARSVFVVEMPSSRPSCC